MPRNPYTDTTEAKKQAVEDASIFNGKVISSPPHNDETTNRHHVVVRPQYTNTNVTCDYPVTAIGDVNPPTEGSWVTVARRGGGNGTIIGTLYAGDATPPQYVQGERIISHEVSDSTVEFRPDGSLVVSHEDGMQLRLSADGNVYLGGGDGEISLGGGQIGVITDISMQDGTLSIERSETVFVSE